MDLSLIQDVGGVQRAKSKSKMRQVLRGAWRRGIAGYDIVRVVLGLVLLTAAGLKTYQLATAPIVEAGLLDSRWFLIAVVEFELLFGLWLLWGFTAQYTWAAAVLCFSCFACVSLYKALSGEAMCGCFGAVPVNPWVTSSLDAVFVLALIAFHPRFNAERLVRSAGIGPAKRRWVAIGTLTAVYLLVAVPTALAMATQAFVATAGLGDLISGEVVVQFADSQHSVLRIPVVGAR